MGILANEADQLPDAVRASLRRFQADYLDLWVQALRAVLPDERGPTELKIVVHAVQSLVYYVVRTEPREGSPGLHRRLTDLGMATLLEG
jgi:hypothetical protein